jgi:hypothetical protein
LVGYRTVTFVDSYTSSPNLLAAVTRYQQEVLV